MSQFEVGIAEGVHALDYNQRAWYDEGYAVVSGCAPSDGSGDLEVDIASGSIYFGGSEVSVASQTVTLTAGQTDPRKDTIWLDSNGNAQVTNGTPAAPLPRGAARADTYQPAPPMPGTTPSVVVAVVWVPSGAGDIGSADIQDRRSDATSRAHDMTVARLDVNPLASGQITATGGSDPAADVTVPGVTTDETLVLEVLTAPASSPSWSADYGFNVDLSHQYDASDGEVDAQVVVTWDVDPGSGNDLTLDYKIVPRY